MLPLCRKIGFLLIQTLKFMFQFIRFLIFATVFSLSITNCQKKETVIRPAFYFWQTHLDKDNFESDFVRQQGIERLYICLLNVEINPQNQVVPRMQTAVDWSILPPKVSVVPVIYLPNRVFEHLDSLEIGRFAENLTRFFSEKIPPSVFSTFSEIQLDCDWTEKTRGAYFDFLKRFKTLIHKPLSATIRLHQIKYRKKTGIPPVERGALMLYNLNAPNQFSEKNSIFDAAECRKYLDNAKPYELPLDVALPLFSWGLAFRNQQYQGIFNGLNTTEARNLSFLKSNNAARKNYFQVAQDTVFRDLYLRNGDEIEVEEISENDLLAAADMAKTALNADTTNVIFYHLNGSILKNYTPDVFKKVLNRLR